MPDLWTRLRGGHGQINGYRSVWLMRGGGGNRGECLVSLIYGETVYRSISPCSIVKSTRCPVWVIGNSWLVDRAQHTKPNPQGQKPPPTAYNTPIPRVKNPQPHGHIHHRDYIPPPINKYIYPPPSLGIELLTYIFPINTWSWDEHLMYTAQPLLTHIWGSCYPTSVEFNYFTDISMYVTHRPQTWDR